VVGARLTPTGLDPLGGCSFDRRSNRHLLAGCRHVCYAYTVSDGAAGMARVRFGLVDRRTLGELRQRMAYQRPKRMLLRLAGPSGGLEYDVAQALLLRYACELCVRYEQGEDQQPANDDCAWARGIIRCYLPSAEDMRQCIACVENCRAEAAASMTGPHEPSFEAFLALRGLRLCVVCDNPTSQGQTCTPDAFRLAQAGRSFTAHARERRLLVFGARGPVALRRTRAPRAMRA